MWGGGCGDGGGSVLFLSSWGTRSAVVAVWGSALGPRRCSMKPSHWGHRCHRCPAQTPPKGTAALQTPPHPTLPPPPLPTEALAEPELCYILDGILFLYGIVLTILYCHLKVSAGTPTPLGAELRAPSPTPASHFGGLPSSLFLVFGGNLRLILSLPCRS